MFLFASLTLAGMLAADPGATLGYTSVSPIAIQSCAVEPVSTNYIGGGGDSGAFLPETLVNGENLYIKFLNNTNKQISKVNFAVMDGANQTAVIDSGMFSPGVAVTHLLKYMPDAAIVRGYNSSADYPSCTVSSVLFSDGTTWARPVATAINK